MSWKKGDKVGPYRIVKQQGKGGMATVYRAYHPELDRHVAIKVMHQSFLEDSTFVTRFKREAQIVAKLEHPNIVPVYDYKHYKGQPLLVMKFIQGHTLKEHLIEQVPSLEEILEIMTPVADALDYAHKKGVLHRDIKPSNIVIDDEGTPYLADFGLARIAQAGESSMSADMLLGTPNYMSPEQALGEKNLTPQADIYSLGVVLYELLVGHVPFKADTPFAVIHDHIYTPVPIPSVINPEIPSEIEIILLKALSKNPEERHETASQMMDELRIAVQKSNLNELDANRASIALASMAKYRSEVIPQRVSTIRSDSNRTELLDAQQAALVSGQGRIWIVGGLGAFLILMFLSLLVLMNTWDNILSLIDLAAREDDEIGNFDDLPMRPDLSNPLPTYIMPPISPFVEASRIEVEDIDNPIIYLVLAETYYREGNRSEALKTIQAGYSEVEDRIRYLFTASTIAEQHDDTLGSIGFAVGGAYFAFGVSSDEFPPEAINAISQRLYELGLEAGSFDPRQSFAPVLGDILQSPSFGPGFIDSIGTKFVVIHSDILSQDPRRASVNIVGLTDEQRDTPEFQLLIGKYEIVRNNTDEAITIWEALAESRDVPGWVRDEASQLIESTQG